MTAQEETRQADIFREQRRIGRSPAESVERWPGRTDPPTDAPNVVLILLDDVGFAQFGCFGSSISTPAIDRLAAEGLRFTNFHTTAVCSPTRASLLTGRNCHSVGFGHVTERLAGYPGYSMSLPDEAGTIAQILQANGYSTRAVGKWHLTPSYETGPQGPFDRWPLSKGFDRFYGFLTGSTDQYSPELCRDNSPTTPSSSSPGYHLSEDLVDEGLKQIRDLRGSAPRHPFFLYLAFGAGHAPHQVPPEWIDRYQGAFDHGWDEERANILARQIELGVMPAGTELGTNNPGVQAWSTMSEEQRRLAARMMEVYAGFISHTDAQIGRLLEFLDEIGERDNTIVMLCSDNGASGEGGPDGSVDEGLYLSDTPQRAIYVVRHADDLGGPKLYNHYPWGWAQAGNTPFRWYKQFTHAGGITNGLVMRWPAGQLPAGEFRRQYHHVIDVAPTLLDVIGIDPPTRLKGITQRPMHGVSMRYCLQDGDAEGRRFSQHYEMWGNRGMWQDGWMAVCRLQPDGPGAIPGLPVPQTLDELRWELYDHRTDPSECHDLAEQHPETLRRLVETWWAAAGKYDVLPVDNRQRNQRWPVSPPLPIGADPRRAVFHGPSGPFERGTLPSVADRSFRLTADIAVPGDGCEGVLYMAGGRHGGYCWYVKNGLMHAEVSSSSIQTATVSATTVLAPGRHRVELSVAMLAGWRGEVVLSVDDEVVGRGEVDALLKRIPNGSSRTFVGRAGGAPTSEAFEPPFAFTGGLTRLMLRPGPTSADVSAEARAAVLAREDAAEMRDQ